MNYNNIAAYTPNQHFHLELQLKTITIYWLFIITCQKKGKHVHQIVQESKVTFKNKFFPNNSQKQKDIQHRSKIWGHLEISSILKEKLIL